jgi:hypothetical protein
MESCKHNERIQILKVEHGYEWSCVECGQPIAHWASTVWDALMEGMPELVEGEGFTFRVVENAEARQPSC